MFTAMSYNLSSILPTLNLSSSDVLNLKELKIYRLGKFKTILLYSNIILSAYGKFEIGISIGNSPQCYKNTIIW